MFHLATHRNRWYVISLLLVMPGILALLFWRLNLGIDFTGGTIWELEFEQPVTTEQVRASLATEGRGEATVQLSSSDDMSDNVAIIRMEELPQLSEEKQRLEAALEAEMGPFEELQISTVGSSVSSEISQKAIIAVLAASVGILLYIAFAFRNTQNPFLYGICAIVAMLHDVLFVLGVFAILGQLFDVQVDALFVTAILTVIGFSVHDTIVVFDRIRENLANQTDPDFEGVVNYSLAQTIVRSVNTSLTVIFTLLALYLFGGESTRNFVLALLLGIVIGTFSSIFTAAQLLVSWELGDFQRWWNKLLRRETAAAAAS
ncbi:MAG: protein translocase subunit SecF [Thermomicrobiales bacterium]|nr:protein translocase subunit SecF [Thermomicrobiales bacterium]